MRLYDRLSQMEQLEENEDAEITLPSWNEGESSRTIFPTPQFLKRNFMLRAAASSAIGALMGLANSLVVNVSLVEISISRYFALYFAILFIFLGGLIAWRVRVGRSPDPNENLQNYLFIFAVLVIGSGVLSLFLVHDWIVWMPRLFKLIIYALLGISIAFAFSFTVVDVINTVTGFFQRTASKPLVQSAQQIRFIVIMAVAMGAIFGIIFAFLRVEDEMPYRIKVALMREERYCLPIGLLFGAAAGFGNEYFANKSQLRDDRVVYSEFEAEI